MEKCPYCKIPLKKENVYTEIYDLYHRYSGKFKLGDFKYCPQCFNIYDISKNITPIDCIKRIRELVTS